MRSLMIRVCALGVVVLAGKSPCSAQTIDHRHIPAVALLPQATMDAIGQQKWFFTHASIGSGMIYSLNSLRTGNSTRYKLQTASWTYDGVNKQVVPPPSPTSAGFVYESMRGNPWPSSEKFLIFANSLNYSGWHMPAVQIVMDKLCYADDYANATQYISSMNTLELTYPDTRFVYATMPLMTAEDAANVRRNQYNTVVRSYCQQNGKLLYDIADMESHDSNGTEIGFYSGGVFYQKMYSPYSTDGGHLTYAASEWITKGWYAVAAVIVGGLDCNGNLIPDTLETGVCCFTDSTCQVLLQANCTTAGGTSWLVGEDCDPNPCSLPTGACCLNNGTCQSLTEAACTTAGGEAWADGQACVPNLCEKPGACCFHDGHCEMSSVIDPGNCASGGAYMGDGSICTPNSCVQPTGSCCFHDGSCQVLLASDCSVLNGIWTMDGVCDPNPCVQPTGACCFHNGTCQVLVDAACTSAGGEAWTMDGVCDPNTCPQPMGACCSRTTGACTIVTQAACASSNGTFQGNWTTCSPNPCPPPTGSCCFADGHCEQLLSQEACNSAPGHILWSGLGTTCDPNPCPQPTGACCFSASGTCQYLTSANCAAQGGAYQGNSTSCNLCIPANDECENAQSIQVLPYPEQNHIAFSTQYATPSVGAPSCGERAGGNITGDVWYKVVGSGRRIILDTCESPTTYTFDAIVNVYCDDCGVLTCVASGDSNYNYCVPGQYQVEAAKVEFCSRAGTTYLIRVHTAWENGNTGAFVLRVINTSVSCTATDACTLGACCFADGSCQSLTSASCTTAGGAGWTSGRSCEPNQCPQPTGACCDSETGECTIATRVACEPNVGVYQGNGTICSPPNMCQQPCLLLGDVNQDGAVNGLDIECFVRVKLNQSLPPSCNPACADFGSGTLDGDIALFVGGLLD